MVLAVGSVVATVVTLGAAAPAATAGFIVASGPLATLTIATGPFGLAALGTESILSSEENSPITYTFDCWKPVLHDQSKKPSMGIPVKDVVLDPRIKNVTIRTNETEWPQLILENVWSEKFIVNYMMLENGKMAAHASKIDEFE